MFFTSSVFCFLLVENIVAQVTKYFIIFHHFLRGISASFQSPVTNTTMLCAVFIVELNEACVAAPENNWK